MSKEMEFNVLCGVCKDFELNFESLEQVGINKDDFEDEENRTIYQAMRDVHKRGLKEFPYESLLDHGLEESNAKAIYSTLQGGLKPGSYTYNLQKMVIKKQDELRENVSRRYLKLIKEEEDFEKKSELSNDMMTKLQQLEMMFVGDDEQNLKEIVPNVYNAQALDKRPIKSGFDWLDQYTKGFFRGLPAIIAAESGNGKSTMLRNLSMRMALEEKYGGLGYRVLIVSLEMTKEMLTQQYIAMLNNDEMEKWFNFNIQEEDMDKKRSDAEKLASTVPNLKIDDNAYTPEKLARKIRSAKGRYDMIFVDYFQAITIADGQNEGQAYNRASKLITRAIKETKDVAVCLLSQITAKDGVKAKTEKQHQEAKLRYAKQLLNDTAFELIVYRDPEEEGSEDEPDFDNSKNEINLFIRKNRNGTPDVHTRFPYLDSKGIIGNWKAVKPEETEEEYLHSLRWKKGEKPTFDYHNVAVAHMNRLELREIGFVIPEHVIDQIERNQGIRQHVIDAYNNGTTPDEPIEEEPETEDIEFMDIPDEDIEFEMEQDNDDDETFEDDMSDMFANLWGDEE